MYQTSRSHKKAFMVDRSRPPTFPHANTHRGFSGSTTPRLQAPNSRAPLTPLNVRDFSDVGSESSPIRRPPASAPTPSGPASSLYVYARGANGAEERASTGRLFSGKSGGGGLVAARQLRAAPPHQSSVLPPRTMHNNFMPLLADLPRTAAKQKPMRRTVGNNNNNNTFNADAATAGGRRGSSRAFASNTNATRKASTAGAPPQPSLLPRGAERGRERGAHTGTASTSGGTPAADPFAIHKGHPFYEELRALASLKAALLVRAANEKQKDGTLAKDAHSAAVLGTVLAMEKEKLEARIEGLATQKGKILSLGTPAEAKAALASKNAELQGLKTEYQEVMLAIRQLEGGGSGANGNLRSRSTGIASSTFNSYSHSSGAKNRLQASLDVRRLADEEALIAKYSAQGRRLQQEAKELTEYLGKLTEAIKEGGIGGGAGKATVRLLTPLGGEGEDKDTSPSRRAAVSARVAERRTALEQLRRTHEEEEAKLEAALRGEVARATAAFEEANDRFMAAQHLSEDHRTQVQTMRASVSSKMAAAAQKRAEAEAHKKTATNLELEIENFGNKLRSLEAALKDCGQNIEAARCAHADALSANARREHEAEASAKRELAELSGKIASEAARLGQIAKEKEELLKTAKVTSERLDKQAAARGKLEDQYEKAKERLAEARALSQKAKEQHQNEMNEASFTTQKGTVIADLRTRYDKESLKLADVERQNTQLEKVLKDTVDLLTKNNVEVLF